MEYIKVVMLRSNLANIPQYALPAGYSFRFYRPGDARIWVRIWQEAESTNKLQDVNGQTFTRAFGGDLRAMERRCLFMVSPQGRDVGTTTSWYDRNYAGQAWGRIHWVALSAEIQGKGLAKPMMTEAMNLLKRLGHRRAILGTQAPRLAAIKLYLDFGFVPDMSAPDAQRAWRMVQAQLRHPALS